MNSTRTVIGTATLAADTTVTRTYETAGWWTRYAIPAGTEVTFTLHGRTGTPSVYVSFAGKHAIEADHIYNRVFGASSMVESKAGQLGTAPSLHLYDYTLRRKLPLTDGTLHLYDAKLVDVKLDLDALGAQLCDVCGNMDGRDRDGRSVCLPCHLTCPRCDGRMRYVMGSGLDGDARYACRPCDEG